jgi:hypothetical protein
LLLTTGFYFGLFFTLGHNFKGVHMVDDTSRSSNRQGNKNSFLYKQEGDSTTTAYQVLANCILVKHQNPAPISPSDNCHIGKFGFQQLLPIVICD